MNERSDHVALTRRLRSLLVSAMSEQLFQARRRQFDAGRSEEQVAASRKLSYRYGVLAIAAVIGPVQAYNFFVGHYLPAAVGVIILALFIFNIFLLVRDRPPFLSAPSIVLLSVTLLAMSIVYGKSHNLYWVYPLLVALPVMLRSRAAIWLSMLIGAAVLLMSWQLDVFDTDTFLIVSLSMAHTWIVGAWLLFVLTQTESADEESTTDELTGAFNRRHLLADVRGAFRTYRRYEVPSTLLLLGVDEMDRLETAAGTQVAQDALRSVTRLLLDRLRAADRVFRYDDDQLLALLKETDESRSIPVAEQIRFLVEKADVAPGHDVTVSIGVCDALQADSVDHWLSQCERALYQARRDGSNGVVIATPGAMSGDAAA
jgi:diguanylate cyclase (GGDEF)-like protein